jgi:hypothetical protein
MKLIIPSIKCKKEMSFNINKKAKLFEIPIDIQVVYLQKNTNLSISNSVYPKTNFSVSTL